MTFRKGEGRKTNVNAKLKGKEIEKVKTVNYSGYLLKENNGDEGHIEAVLGKAKQLWAEYGF